MKRADIERLKRLLDELGERPANDDTSNFDEDALREKMQKVADRVRRARASK